MKNTLLLFTLFFTLLSFSSCKDVEAFKTKGVEVEATVEGIKTKRKKKKTKHYLQLSYFTKSQEQGTKNEATGIEIPKPGTYTTVEKFITKYDAKKYQKGDKIAIVYLPEDPKDFMFKEDLQ